ncbi:MAG: class I SAM-dependent methyltransferase [Candidatus Omnitrophica bacterium]|nr:class I SAM-dependent methyltransferase [Candidatus Omnitrophota bacterium]
MIKGFISRLGDHPLWNYYMQIAAHMGDFTYSDRIKTALAPEKGDKVLDAGCGLGLYNMLADFYVGVDSNKDHLAWARKRFVKGENKYFVAGDLTEVEFSFKAFDRAICSRVLHHLSDAGSAALIKKLARLTKKRVLFVDRIPPGEKATAGEKFFLKLEKGHFVRPLEDTIRLIEEDFIIENVSRFMNRTRTGECAVIPAAPR